jgi:hypothetical protein
MMSKTLSQKLDLDLQDLIRGCQALNLAAIEDTRMAVYAGTAAVDLHLPNRVLEAAFGTRTQFCDGLGFQSGGGPQGELQLITDNYNLTPDGSALQPALAAVVGRIAARGRAERLAARLRSRGYRVTLAPQENGTVLLRRHVRSHTAGQRKGGYARG